VEIIPVDLSGGLGRNARERHGSNDPESDGAFRSDHRRSHSRLLRRAPKYGSVRLGHAEKVPADPVIAQRVVMHADPFTRLERRSPPPLPSEQSRARSFEVPLDDCVAFAGDMDAQPRMRISPAPLHDLAFDGSSLGTVERSS